jgi:RNA polymerase sigma factor (sigma-70 family)
MIDVLGVGITNTYPNHEQKAFMPLSEYLLAAQKAIKFFAPKVRAGLVNELLDSEDAISNVAYAMMIADWKYKDGMGMTQYNYRNNYALFAIRSYIVRKSKSLKKTGVVKSLDFEMSDDYSFYKIICDAGPVDHLDMMAEDDSKLNEITDCLSDGTVTEKQAKCIQMYYFDGLTYEQIGNTMGVTKERVRQNINNGIEKIKEKIDV